MNEWKLQKKLNNKLITRDHQICYFIKRLSFVFSFSSSRQQSALENQSQRKHNWMLFIVNNSYITKQKCAKVSRLFF